MFTTALYPFMLSIQIVLRVHSTGDNPLELYIFQFVPCSMYLLALSFQKALSRCITSYNSTTISGEKWSISTR